MANPSDMKPPSPVTPPPVRFPPKIAAPVKPPEQAPASHALKEETSLLGSVTPLRVLRVLIRKWTTIVLMTAFAATLAFFYLWTTPKIYRAVSLIEMTQRKPRIMNQQSAVIDDNSYSPSEEIFNTRLKKFNGQALRDAALARFKLLYPCGGRTDKEIMVLMGGASFSLLNKTSIVQIQCDRNDPKLAAAVANAYAETAEIFTIEENRKEAEDAVTWLQAQADTQRLALEKAEATIVDFRTRNKVDVLESQQKSIEEATLSLRKSQMEVESQLVLSRNMADTLATLEIIPESVGKLPDTVPKSEEIRKAVEKWMTAIEEKKTMLTRYTVKHPEVIAREKTIEMLKSGVADAIRNARQTADSNVELLQQQTISLKEKLADQGRQAAELDKQIVEGRSKLTALEREREACDISYRGVLNRIEEAKLSADEKTTTVKVQERALEPRFPDRPRVMRIWLLALIFGFSAGLVMSLVTDTLEDRITSTYDIEHGMGLRILGLVPHVSRGKREELALAGIGNKYVQVAESFAGIRNVLETRRLNKVCSASAVVVSTAPEEGKTITACNLAVMIAKTGKRTILVDLDLRRPRIGRIFNMPETIDSVIRVLGSGDKEAFQKLPFASHVNNLWVAGSRPNTEFSPAEILGGTILQQFINWLRLNFEFAVIDSPPIGVVADALVISRLSGCAVMVCRPDVSRKRATRFAYRQLNETGAEVLGIVVNDVDFDKSPYFSNYDHHYDYSHYSYYYTDE